MLREIMFIPDDYKERFGDKHFAIPDNCNFFGRVCYADNGDPVVFEYGKPFTMKVGKRRWAKITLTKEEENELETR